ncbi:hypothetical protein [Vibrio ezurae]|uniref:Porin domain-containing protein n=1 Tax=Vibrio ezurae NBRC 102218 TaxID=1219080 RepID=U3B5I8_9VIBR|nr:hypothetical protein [Vibrio ezurae]GAD81200.1 hypothetical protein VEZ01S_52_00580 [Vibrio ezurae NBRC 102218]
MRIFAFFSLFVSLSTAADTSLVNTIEKFTDIFGISFSQYDGSTVATLDGNYYVTERLRVFGDIDTDLNWEVGSGYSIWSGETYYTENSFTVSEYKLSTGIFIAKMLDEKWTLIGDVNYNYKFDSERCFANFQEICPTESLSDSVDYSAGVIWSPIKYIDLLYKFNQEIGFKKNEYYFPNLDETFQVGNTNEIFHEVVAFINLKYLRPSITYTTYRDENREDTIEFGLTFDF